jgi:D-alanine--poly(phosphoribitol) ligase subunit 1
MHLNVLEYLEKYSLEISPNKIFLQDGDSAFTFLEVFDRARKLASMLTFRTSGVNSPIAVFLPKSMHVVVADLAVVYTGNFYTNLDEKSPPERLSRLLENVRPVLTITSTEFIPTLISAGVPAGQIVNLDEVDFVDLQVNEDLLMERRSQTLDTDPLCLINTSGSTGIPKSVILNHRSTIDFIDWCTEQFEFTKSDVMGSLSPLYFDIYTLELFVSLKSGCSISLIPEKTAAFPATLVQHLSSNGITFVFWVPTIMVNIANLGLLDEAELSMLRRVFFAGEVFPTKHLNMWRRALPRTQFVNLYGPIEITVDCTFFEVDREFADNEPIPIGKPCRNTGILILTEDNRLAASGEIGELCVRGSSLALGYYNNPEQTSKAFCQNPLNNVYPELIYRTGDLVHLNDRGEIMFDGRKDFQIKHLGYRIELAEIETAVLSLPGMRNACVLYNKEAKAIVLIFESSSSLTAKNLRSQLQAELPKYMLPTTLVELDSIPMNANGKIDRQALAREYAP